MPKAMNYKSNSVIYFRGDVSDRIFILKSGRVSLSSNDIETGQEVHEYIQTGEFFGVKSALGKYPREEDAVVLADSECVMFSVPEFEQLVSTNTRIIMKMLKVFSNQLRRIHVKVRNLLDSDEQGDSEVGLFRIGEYYLKKKQYNQAIYVLRRYIHHYPNGKLVADAKRQLSQAEDYAQKYGIGKGPSIQTAASTSTTASRSSLNADGAGGLTDMGQVYYNAVSIFSQQKYSDALREFKKIAEQSTDNEYSLKAMYEIGRCLFSMKQLEPAIRHFTGLIQKYPKIPELNDALYYIGRCYQDLGDRNRAASFYKKILSLPAVDEGTERKVKQAIRLLEAG
ncbi:MAG TPA: tetratricopeptide repeat protein [Spirochaetia bacterium]|nr:tetratricopeptide repeat protein [Spirochaetia bacterium]